MTALDRFSRPVRTWFQEALGQPTPAQELGWPPIQAGEHTLILSPTGSGKTLAAFLWGIDRLFAEVAAGGEPQGVRLLYVSPLKALNNDIERNLRLPLSGAREVARRLGSPLPELRVAVRTGDTPGRARLAMLKKPPHILITTPESLYLILTSARARDILHTVHTVIIDEIHTVAGNKRGVHLALSLERLAHLTGHPVQRIGLSATQRPLEEIARFLGGQEWRDGPEGRRALVERPVTIVDAGHQKPLDLQVITTVTDFRELGASSIWPSIEQQVADLVRSHRTTLIFANGRRLVERIANHLNEHFEPGTIRAHHGSMAPAARLEMEADLKAGRLPALVGTSSLELGIDIGSVDLVIQLQSPKGVARGLQRVGRSGHLVGQTSVGRIFATHREDLMEAAAVAGAMKRGEVELTRVPENCLDVLAQQVLAAVSVEPWSAAALYDLVRQSYPYRDLPLQAYQEVLAMLAGKYPREAFRELRPRLDWDRPADRLSPLPGSRFLATTNGGTIADRGTFAVYHADGKSRIGELDEEFVYEQRVGTVFTLGSHTWRIVHIADDRVLVADAADRLPSMPFWRGDVPWRTYELGREVGRFRRQVAERLDDPQVLDWLRRDHALDENSAHNVLRYVREQVEAIGAISSDRTIIVELFRDPVGDRRMVIHSPFGGRVNGAWALALTGAFRDRTGTTPECQTNDDGILLRFPEADRDPPLDLVINMTPQEARERILAELPDSALFGAHFRQNAARALLMPRARGHRRTPFWLQRLRAKDLLAITRQFASFPIIVETYRDCLRDVLDLEHLLEVLGDIRHGRIRVLPVERLAPSPLAAGLLFNFVAVYMYEWDAPKAERQFRALSLDRDLLGALLKDASLADLLKPEALAELQAYWQRTAPERRARGPEEMAVILSELGDLSTEELLSRTQEGGREWLAALLAQGRLLERQIPTVHGPERRWILAEEADLYRRAFDDASATPAEVEQARQALLRRLLMTHGPISLDAIRLRYDLPEAWLVATLQAWAEARRAVHGRLAPGQSGEQWCDRRNLEQAHRRTLSLLRREIQPVPVSRYIDFLTRWQHVHPQHQLARSDGIRRAIQQLRAFSAPALLWERNLLPARVQGFNPSDLRVLCESGEVVWVGSGKPGPSADGSAAFRPGHLRARFLFRGEGSLYLPAPAKERTAALSESAQRILAFLGSEGACFTSDLERGTQVRGDTLGEALIELVASGLVTNDSLLALRELVHFRPGVTDDRRPLSSLEQQLAQRWHGPREHRAGRLREARHRTARRLAAAPQWVGRWSLVHRMGIWGADASPEECLDRWVRLLLARYGIVSRDCLARENLPWTWADLYSYLETLEMRGEIRRGYFIQGLVSAQFALPEAVERLREWGAQPPGVAQEMVVVNAWDPTWFLASRAAEGPGGPGGTALSVRRRASTYAVLHQGQPVLFAERGGRSLIVPAGVDGALLSGALRSCLTALAARTRRRRLVVETWDGASVLGSLGQPLLESLGAYPHAPFMEWQAPRSP